MISFILNDKNIQTSLPPGTTVLDFVRYRKHLVGTKIGCREGDCGACTVLVGEVIEERLRYRSMTSCLMPLANAHGKHIVTIEGLNLDELSPVQQAIVEEGGSQCGFCTVGFVVSLCGFTMDNQPATYQNALAAIDGNICRCTGYKSLERAAGRVVKALQDRNEEESMSWLVKNSFLPVYFLNIKERLEQLELGLAGQTSLNGNGRPVGGGTDLYVQQPEEMAETPFQPIFHKKGWKEIYEKDGHCHIGTAATPTDLLESELMLAIFPKFPTFMAWVSSTPIRNMGTLSGNFVNASPIGDLTIFFLALDSTIVLNNKGKKRELPLQKFYKGYKTLDLQDGEVVESLYFKIPDKGDYFNFEKVCKREYLDIASVNSACYLKITDGIIEKAHLSAGGVSPVPLYLEKSSKAMEGAEVSGEMLGKIARVIQEEISPISDARGSSGYKRLLMRQLFFVHFLEVEAVSKEKLWEGFKIGGEFLEPQKEQE